MLASLEIPAMTLNGMRLFRHATRKGIQVMGKFLVLAIIISAIFVGSAVYYLQVYHFYEVKDASGREDVLLRSRLTGRLEPLTHTNFTSIDAASSPIRYRACFSTDLDPKPLIGAFEEYFGAEPLSAPGWFDCFDAKALGAALENGTATAFLGQFNVQYGVDRVVAITESGDGYIWHQINICGKAVFNGKELPKECPEPSQGK